MLVVSGVGVVMSRRPGRQGVSDMRLMLVVMIVVVMHFDTLQALDHHDRTAGGRHLRDQDLATLAPADDGNLEAPNRHCSFLS